MPDLFAAGKNPAVVGPFHRIPVREAFDRFGQIGVILYGYDRFAVRLLAADDIENLMGSAVSAVASHMRSVRREVFDAKVLFGVIPDVFLRQVRVSELVADIAGKGKARGRIHLVRRREIEQDVVREQGKQFVGSSPNEGETLEGRKYAPISPS